MLNAGILKFTPTGAISTLPEGSSSPYFNGGTPVDKDGNLYISESPPAVFVGGLGYTNKGSLCVALSGVKAVSIGGFSLTQDGRVLASNAAISFYNAGLPFDVSGRLIMNANFTPNFLITQSGLFILTQSGLNIRVTP